MKLMTKDLEDKLSKHPLYSHEDEGTSAECLVKYFNPIGSGTWYVVEAEKQQDGDWLFFGLVDLIEKEWGYFSLSELEEVKLPFGLSIERDMYCDGKSISELLSIERNDSHQESKPEDDKEYYFNGKVYNNYDELENLIRTIAEDDYDYMLDDCYEEIVFGELRYSPSTVLKKVDPIAYECGIDDYENSLWDEVTIIDKTNNSYDEPEL